MVDYPSSIRAAIPLLKWLFLTQLLSLAFYSLSWAEACDAGLDKSALNPANMPAALFDAKLSELNRRRDKLEVELTETNAEFEKLDRLLRYHEKGYQNREHSCAGPLKQAYAIRDKWRAKKKASGVDDRDLRKAYGNSKEKFERCMDAAIMDDIDYMKVITEDPEAEAFARGKDTVLFSYATAHGRYEQLRNELAPDIKGNKPIRSALEPRHEELFMRREELRGCITALTSAKEYMVYQMGRTAIKRGR